MTKKNQDLIYGIICYLACIAVPVLIIYLTGMIMKEYQESDMSRERYQEVSQWMKEDQQIKEYASTLLSKNSKISNYDYFTIEKIYKQNLVRRNAK